MARGTVNRIGYYVARFTVPTSLLTRGTVIYFLIKGKKVASLRV